MSWTRRLLAVGGVAAGVLAATAVPASAHGAMFGPTSRVAVPSAEAIAAAHQRSRSANQKVATTVSRKSDSLYPALKK